MTTDAIELARFIDEQPYAGNANYCSTLATALLAMAAERDELRRVVQSLQDDLLHRDETLALIERNEPVRAFFTLANVMRECRDANTKIAALSARRDRLAAALREACDITDELGYGHAEIPAARRIADLRALAEGGE